MAEKAPYRLQVFLSDTDRERLRRAAYEEYTSIQKLVEGILRTYLDQRDIEKKDVPARC